MESSDYDEQLWFIQEGVTKNIICKAILIPFLAGWLPGAPSNNKGFVSQSQRFKSAQWRLVIGYRDF